MPEWSALQAAAAIRSGEVSAESYAAALITQSEDWAGLNAFISQDHANLLEAARAADKQRASGAQFGQLHGVPLVFKDNIATVDLPTTAGTGALRNYMAKENARVAQALFDAGALLFGKTNMHELAAGVTNNNVIYGAVRNPYNMAMIPGGSSGGTGAAIAARVSPAGFGTDTGGSVRIPAGLCGICGLRPTVGRYSGAGIVPFAGGRAIAGPMARTVADLALLDGIVTGENEPLPLLDIDGLRLGVPETYFYEDIDPHVASVTATALNVLEKQGAILVRKSVAGLDEMLQRGRGGPSAFETYQAYATFFSESDVGISPEEYVAGIGDDAIRERLGNVLLGSGVPEPAPGEGADAIRSGYRDIFVRYFAENDLNGMIIPPTPMPARPIGQDETVELNGKQVSTFLTFVRNTLVGAAAGLPGIVIPAGMTENGLPVGVEIDAPPGADRKLLSIAGTIEELMPRLPKPI
jgi:mandelamide amidase